MCGIAGIIHKDGSLPSEAIIRGMTSLLAHRGPDDEGFWTRPGVGLGHRRLAIVDPEGGQQPMEAADGSIVVVTNGEFFNFKSLRSELQRTGRQFFSSSDTEVLVQAYAEYGEEAFARLRGQFAFCLYDILQQKIYLVRDRMGEKPLYVWEDSKTVVFASEVKAVLMAIHCLNVRVELAPQALFDFLSLNYVPFGKTLVSGIESVCPATYVLYSGKQRSVKQYWHIPPHTTVSVQKINQTFDSEYLPIFESKLKHALHLRRESDTPVGLMLSGGIDSSLIAALLADEGISVRTFVASFSDSRFDEYPRAALLAHRLGHSIHRVPIDLSEESLPELLRALSRHGDTPLADSSSLAVFLLSRAISKEVKVVLTGDGADELFGGYLTYPATMVASHIPQKLHSLFTTLISSGLQCLPRSRGNPAKVGWREKLSRFSRGLGYSPAAAHFSWNGTFSAPEKLHLLNRNLLGSGALFSTFDRIAADCHLSNALLSESALYRADQQTYLVDDILAKVDRMTLAHGLEARPLYLDHDIVEFSYATPFALTKRKALMRRLLHRLVPWYQPGPKQGFSLPIHEWMRTYLRDFAGDSFASCDTIAPGILNRPEVMRYWDEHLRGIDRGFDLWGILMLLLWFQEIWSSESIDVDKR